MTDTQPRRRHQNAVARAELAARRAKAMPARHRQRLAHLAASPVAQPLIEHLDRLRAVAQTIAIHRGATVTTHNDAEQQLAALRAELAAERASRQDWAAEAMRLDIENERLRSELDTNRPTSAEAAAS